jgi:hypothetical protein
MSMGGPMAEFLDGMMSGMWILAVPAFFVVSAIAWLAWRRRDRTAS